MPNYCQNKLEVKGSKKDLETFAKKYFAKTKDNHTILDFNKIIPEPKTKKDLLEKYGHDFILDDNHTHIEKLSSNPDEAYIQQHFDWYNWRIKYWGTKWGCIYNSEPIVDKTKLIYYYDTAWSPADGIITKLAIDNPKLEINNYYYEPGMNFGGCVGSVNMEVKDSPNYGLMKWAIKQGLESQEFLDELIESQKHPEKER